MKTSVLTTFGGALAIATAISLAGSPAHAMQSYDECLADNAGVQTWGCYDLYVTPSGSPAASVEMAWTLNTTAEGFNNADWQGGIVLTRWPVRGQWKTYPPLDAVNIPGPHEDCSSPETINASNCYRTFSGPTGTLRLDFGPSMAGYVYEVYSHDYIAKDGGQTWGPSGGSVDRYVFVLKAFQYKNASGKVVKTAKCPPAKKRQSRCVPAAIAVTADTIGGGDPVPPPGG